MTALIDCGGTTVCHSYWEEGKPCIIERVGIGAYTRLLIARTRVRQLNGQSNEQDHNGERASLLKQTQVNVQRQRGGRWEPSRQQQVYRPFSPFDPPNR